MDSDCVPVVCLCSEPRRPAGGVHAVSGFAEGVWIQQHGAGAERGAVFVGVWSVFAVCGDCGGPVAADGAGGGEFGAVERDYGAIGLCGEWDDAAGVPGPVGAIGIVLHAGGLRVDGQCAWAVDAVASGGDFCEQPDGGRGDWRVVERVHRGAGPLAGFVLDSGRDWVGVRDSLVAVFVVGSAAFSWGDGRGGRDAFELCGAVPDSVVADHYHRGFSGDVRVVSGVFVVAYFSV